MDKLQNQLKQYIVINIMFVDPRNKRSLWSYCVSNTAAPGFRALEGDVAGTPLSSRSVCSDLGDGAEKRLLKNWKGTTV